MVAARMRCDTSGRPLDIASATCNAPKWATDTSRAVDRSRGAFLSVLTCTVQVLKAQMWLLQAEMQYERSTARHCLGASLCLEMTQNGLKWASERSTALEVHS